MYYKRFIMQHSCITTDLYCKIVVLQQMCVLLTDKRNQERQIPMLWIQMTHTDYDKSLQHIISTLRLMIVSTWAWKGSCGAESTWNPSSILYCSAKTNLGWKTGKQVGNLWIFQPVWDRLEIFLVRAGWRTQKSTP